MIDVWRIVAVAGLILAVLFAALGWPWAAAAGGVVAGTYAGAIGVVCLQNLVNGALIQRIDNMEHPSGGAERPALDQPLGGALSILTTSVQELHELERLLRRQWE